MPCCERHNFMEIAKWESSEDERFGSAFGHGLERCLEVAVAATFYKACGCAAAVGAVIAVDPVSGEWAFMLEHLAEITAIDPATTVGHRTSARPRPSAERRSHRRGVSHLGGLGTYVMPSALSQ